MKEITDISCVHDVLFEGLCYFDSFCRENGLEYYLANGTLLGAAKYGDFIPWDDDVDILMPRKSYDALVKMEHINNADFKLLCKEQLPNWRMPYSKLSCEKTLLEEGEYEFGAEFGLNLDIFPIDNWYPCKAVAKIQSIRSELLKRMLIVANGGSFSTDKTGIKKLLLYLIWRVGKKKGYKKIRETIERSVERSRRYRAVNSGCVCWTCHMTGEVLPSKIFRGGVFLPIKGRSFPAFAGYEMYLDSLYGAWRDELPAEQQHSNHRIKVWWRDGEGII